MGKDVDEIAFKIDNLIKNGVNNALSNEESGYSLMIEMVEEIKYLLDPTDSNVEYYDEKGLTFSKIESEGYRRCALDACEVIDKFMKLVKR